MKDLSDLALIEPYADLFRGFAADVQLQPLASPYILDVSPTVVEQLGLHYSPQQQSEWASAFAGEAMGQQKYAKSSVYSGHQFGQYNPQLGDGRAASIGVLATDSGDWELQIKGGGLTPYSRMGDGRAVLRSSIREYLCSEAMQGLGIPTTQALCLSNSETPVYREEVETGATVVRVAPSFIRFGHFEFFCHTNQHDKLKRLIDYTIAEFYPSCLVENFPYLAFFHQVVQRTAALIARWQCAGFTHGVMNSDNMSILGLTLDYGPFGFMDDFDPGYIPNHSDHSGRYAYDQQPGIGLFNCACLAQALVPFVEVDALKGVLDTYEDMVSAEYAAWMRAKFGLSAPGQHDREVINRFLNLMAESRADFTCTFRALSESHAEEGGAPDSLRDCFVDRETIDHWYADYLSIAAKQHSSVEARLRAMQAVNPVYVLRSYMAQEAIEAAEQGDAAVLKTIRTLLERPYQHQAGQERYAEPAPDWGKSLALSCSS